VDGTIGNVSPPREVYSRERSSSPYVKCAQGKEQEQTEKKPFCPGKKKKNHQEKKKTGRKKNGTKDAGGSLFSPK
jgi:hypothetical protein